MRTGPPPPDPFVLYDTSDHYSETLAYRQTLGRAQRSFSINPALKTLVIVSAGQSLASNVVPTLYVPTNAAVIDNFHLYDGNLYDPAGPLLGCTYNPALVPPLGPGNVYSRICDLLVTNGKFDRIILAPISIGNTSVSQWGDVGGIFADRASKTMARLAARSVTPSTTGVTFCSFLHIGATDFDQGTSQAAFAASAASFISTLRATSFGSGRIFVPLQSGIGHTTTNAIRAAQTSLWNGTNVFSGGDGDSPTITTSDGNHPDDAGAATLATILYNAMHASGAPF